jgi:HD-like signal output (HDOD) protein
MTTQQSPVLDLNDVLHSINSLPAHRPAAARILAVIDAEDTDAKTLADALVPDITLAGRVMKLANSAYYGMRGRVSSLQLAVTVVGFTTVRTMATVALTDMEDESRLPEDFWLVSTSLAVAAARLAPKFDARPADALCLGVLAELGSALLYRSDTVAYGELLRSTPSLAGRRRAEAARYGMSAVEVTAVALNTWGFPDAIITPLQRMEDRSSLVGGLLRAAYEVVSRLTVSGHEPVPIGPLTRGQLRDDDLPEVLYDVRNQAEDLRILLVGD